MIQEILAIVDGIRSSKNIVYNKNKTKRVTKSDSNSLSQGIEDWESKLNICVKSLLPPTSFHEQETWSLN